MTIQIAIVRMSKLKNDSHSRIDEHGNLISQGNHYKKEKRNFGLPEEYMNLGVYLAVPLIFSVIIGPKLDKYFDTKNIFTILFIVLGTISVFYNLYKLYKKG